MATATVATAEETVAKSPEQSGRTGKASGIRPGGWIGFLFIAPNLLGVVAFTLIPLISVIVLAFTDWNLVSGLGGITFNGLDNFVAIAQDPGFWRAVGLTLVYVGVSVPLTVVLGLALGIALNRPLPGRALLRAIFFLPYIVNVVAIGMTWLMLMNPKAGLVNQVLDVFGLQPGWFASSHWALPALIVMAVWGGVGYCSLIYLSALQDAPRQLYEAADIDGAGVWAKFRVITWPSLLPTTIFLLVTLIIGASQGFGLIALITAGGPGDSTTTISYYMYQTGFQFYRFGYASAIGLVTFIGVLALTLVTWRAQRGRALHD